MGAHRLMLVDDEKNTLNALRRVVVRKGIEVECFTDPATALRRAQISPFDLVISDFRMPGVDGVAFLTEVRALQPDSIRMIVSAYGDFNAVVSAINGAGIERFIPKPWNDDELRQAIASALEKRDLMVENRMLAVQLRRAEIALASQSDELARLEREHPGLTHVTWAQDGSILLDAGDL